MDMCNNHSSLPSPRWPEDGRFEIFLSFRGGDVRKGFIEFLYQALKNLGINTFFDRDGIEVGEDIMPRILKVIRQTEICIPVFSKDFASSKSCLKEVAEMVDCDRTIMPIFYDAGPDVVGKQQESYQQSFCNHAAKGVESATIKKWKEALRIVSRKRGWRFEDFNNVEYDLIKAVVSKVSRLLKKDELDVTKNLVGMDHHVREVMKKLGVHYENDQVVEKQMLTGKLVIGISGLPGIGKSTLATIVYNKIRCLFAECSFLKVDGKSLSSLKEDLIEDLRRNSYTPIPPSANATFIKNKLKDQRVLLVLDDVRDYKQIQLLGIHLSEFGPGSRIILISTSDVVDKCIGALRTSQTSGDRCHGILDKNYELDGMDDEHAFQLFCKCALGGEPLGEFSSLARAISSAAQGLPLLIEAIGLSLFGKPKKSWEDQFQIMGRKTFNQEIKGIMKTRYEMLEDDAKKIFLDIACFFMGKDKRIPSYVWEACGYNPHTRLAEIHSKSLVKTTENHELWMHNQVKFLGMEIVREKDPSEPCKHSRLWNQGDIERALNGDMVATVVALSATFNKPTSFDGLRFFQNFHNLIYLRMSHAIIEGNEQSARNYQNLPLLKWLEWHWCHNISSLLALQRSDLVILDLSWCTSRTWNCWKKIVKKARKLKVLILKCCSGLAESPVPDAPINLERLDLEGCSLLPGVGISFRNLGKLVSLNVKSCSFVQKLPEDIGSLVALEELYIDGTSIGALHFPEGSCGKLKILSACNCKSLQSLSNSIGNLKSLSYLALGGTGLSQLPDGIVLLNNLQTLYLRNCRKLEELPESIGSLEELQVMDLSDTVIDELPPSVNNLRNLKVLKMPRTFIREFPRGIKNLERLEEIDFSFCRSLTGECDIRGLSSLRLLLLEKTKFSKVIGTNGQSSDFPNLIQDCKFRIWEKRH